MFGTNSLTLRFSLSVIDAYTSTKANPGDLENAIGFFLAAWFIFTFVRIASNENVNLRSFVFEFMQIMFLASLRTSVSLAALFFFLMLTFMFLMIGAFTVKVKITKIGGGFGLLTAAIAYYTAASHLITSTTSYVSLPVGDLPKRY